MRYIPWIISGLAFAIYTVSKLKKSSLDETDTELIEQLNHKISTAKENKKKLNIKLHRDSMINAEDFIEANRELLEKAVVESNKAK